MPRSRKANGHAPETPAEKPKVAKVRSLLGHNLPPETLKKHYAAVGRLKAEMKRVQGELAAAWKAAEADGIDKKAGKLVFQLFDQDPATADMFMRSIQHYAVQLGLFDKIEDYKAAEEQEANKGSVARAESDKKRAANGGEPKSGGRDEAIYAQGFQAGLDGAARTSVPSAFDADAQDTWTRGHHDGSLKRVDTANSEQAQAGA